MECFLPSTQANCPCSYSNILVRNGLRVPGSMLHTFTPITGVSSPYYRQSRCPSRYCYKNCRPRVVPHFPSKILERAKRERAWKSPHARKARRGGQRERCCRIGRSLMCWCWNTEMACYSEVFKQHCHQIKTALNIFFRWILWGSKGDSVSRWIVWGP